LLNTSKHYLVILIRVGEQFVVVDFQNERDAVGILTRNHPQDTQCSGNGIAAAFEGEFDDVFWVEVSWVGGKGGTSGVFYPLVYWQDGEITRVGKASSRVQLLEAA
jgi:hypothetical protein